MHFTRDIARRPADGLDEASGGPQETLFVSVENGHQRDLGQVEALAQQVDPDQNVVLAEPQLAQQFDPSQRVHFGVQVAHPNAHLE